MKKKIDENRKKAMETTTMFEADPFGLPGTI